MKRLTYSVPYASALFALASSPAVAGKGDDRLKVSGSVRARYEAIGGQPRTDFNISDELVNLRTQILAEYSTGSLRFGVEIFDSRVWGDRIGTPVSTGEVNPLEPVQAYVAAEITEPFGKGTKLSLLAGRFTLNLGSRRLVAADDYRNTTNGYTGLRADMSLPRDVKATFIYTLPQQRLPDSLAELRDSKVKLDRETFDLVLWGGLISKGKALGNAMAELNFFHLGERDAVGRPTRDRSLNTVGGRIIAEPRVDEMDFEVEALYQTGHVSTGLAASAPRQSVSATFLHADLGYTFNGPWKPRLSVEFDRASGDKAGGKFGRFDTYFGMRRADLAPSGLYNAIGRANIVTPGLRLEATPSNRWDWFTVYRAMWLASKEDSFSTTGVRDASGRSGDFAGHQIEARIRYWLIPSRLRFEFDGLLLSKGRFLRTAPNAPLRRWARYGSFNLTSSF